MADQNSDKNQPLRALVVKRAVLKRKITNLFKQIDCSDSQPIIQAHKVSISDLLREVQECDQEVCNVYDQNIVDEELPDDYIVEIDKQSEYSIQISERLAALTDPVVEPAVPKNSESIHGCKPKLPILNCPNFSGEKSSSLDYFSFINQFNT